jgi:hypothetical protein
MFLLRTIVISLGFYWIVGAISLVQKNAVQFNLTQETFVKDPPADYGLQFFNPALENNQTLRIVMPPSNSCIQPLYFLFISPLLDDLSILFLFFSPK